MQNACILHAFCCNDTLPVKTATYILLTVYILLLSLIVDISGSICGAFGVRSGRVRGAFGVRSHNCITREGILSTFRCTHDVPGHFIWVYLRCFWSLYRCIHDIPVYFTGVFTISRVILQVYLRCLG